MKPKKLHITANQLKRKQDNTLGMVDVLKQCCSKNTPDVFHSACCERRVKSFVTGIMQGWSNLS